VKLLAIPRDAPFSGFFSVFGGCLEPGLMGDVNALGKIKEIKLI